jgi:hypothetical protein
MSILLIVFKLSVIMLNVVDRLMVICTCYAECHYYVDFANCLYTECQYAGYILVELIMLCEIYAVCHNLAILIIVFILTVIILNVLAPL